MRDSTGEDSRRLFRPYSFQHASLKRSAQSSGSDCVALQCGLLGLLAGTEDEAIREYKSRHAAALIDTQIKLPKWNGKQLPDIDLLFANPERTHLVLAELKWQLSASSTREVAARNDYLKKGSAQLVAIRDFLAANPEYLKNRGLIDKSTDDLKLSFLLLCKGHLGSETVMTTPEILMCDNDTFLGELDNGFDAAIDLAKSFDYRHRHRDRWLHTLLTRPAANGCSGPLRLAGDNSRA